MFSMRLAASVNTCRVGRPNKMQAPKHQDKKLATCHASVRAYEQRKNLIIMGGLQARTYVWLSRRTIMLTLAEVCAHASAYEA